MTAPNGSRLCRGLAPAPCAPQLFHSAPGHVDAATATVHWLLTDCTGAFPARRGAVPGARPGCPAAVELPRFGWRSGDWFDDNSTTRWIRTIIAYGSWILAAAVLACLGAIILPLLLAAPSAAMGEIWSHAFPTAVEKTSSEASVTWFGSAVHWIGAEIWNDFRGRMGLLVAFAGLLTLLAGIIARIPIFFARDEDDISRQKPGQVRTPSAAGCDERFETRRTRTN